MTNSKVLLFSSPPDYCRNDSIGASDVFDNLVSIIEAHNRYYHRLSVDRPEVIAPFEGCPVVMIDGSTYTTRSLLRRVGPVDAVLATSHGLAPSDPFSLHKQTVYLAMNARIPVVILGSEADVNAPWWLDDQYCVKPWFIRQYPVTAAGFAYLDALNVEGRGARPFSWTREYKVFKSPISWIPVPHGPNPKSVHGAEEFEYAYPCLAAAEERAYVAEAIEEGATSGAKLTDFCNAYVKAAHQCDQIHWLRRHAASVRVANSAALSNHSQKVLEWRQEDYGVTIAIDTGGSSLGEDNALSVLEALLASPYDQSGWTERNLEMNLARPPKDRSSGKLREEIQSRPKADRAPPLQLLKIWLKDDKNSVEPSPHPIHTIPAKITREVWEIINDIKKLTEIRA